MFVTQEFIELIELGVSQNDITAGKTRVGVSSAGDGHGKWTVWIHPGLEWLHLSLSMYVCVVQVR